MANYATNIFYARTECSKDLDTIEAFLDRTFNGYINRQNDCIDAEFSSRWEYPEEEISKYPEEEISKLIASLANKDKVYIKILSYEFDSDYVSFRIFSQGKWNVKL